MKVWERLTLWTNDPLIGAFADDILKLARGYGEPEPPLGLPCESPIGFDYPAIGGDEEAEQFLRRMAILFEAVDVHPQWRRGLLVTVKPFTETPDWLGEMASTAGDWDGFYAQARPLIDAFVAHAIQRFNASRKQTV